MKFFDSMTVPEEANVYTDSKTRNDVMFWEEIDVPITAENPTGKKMVCLAWMRRDKHADSMIDYMRDYIQYMWCIDDDSDPTDLDAVRHRLKSQQKQEGLH